MRPRTARRASIPGIPPSFLLLISLLIVLLIALRFVHLGADFPLGITWSGELYTDEGWYADAATRDVVSGHWYLPGDFNPAVNLPLGQLLQRLAFWLFGLSLVSARLFGAVASSLVILAAALLVRRGAGVPAGLLTALLLASSSIGFAYSRMAVMEPLGILFVMAALLLAQRAAGSHALTRLVLSGLLVAAATLVKGTMIFAVPVVAYMAWRHIGSRRERLLLAAAAVLTSMAVVVGWQTLARHYFYADYTYFDTINLGARRVTGLGDWLSNLHRQFGNMRAIGRGFLDVTILLIAAAAGLAPAFRTRPIVHVLLVYGLAYFALLTIVDYGPPRYFLPLLVPLAGLGAMACTDLAEWLWQLRFRQPRFRLLAGAPFLLAAVMVLGGSARILAYVTHPQYSFLRMTAGVRTLIGHREAKLSDVFLLGHMAESVALETGVRAVNTRMGPVPLSERLARYRPSYVLIHTDAAEVLGAIRSQGGSVTRLGAWDVYRNYYGTGQDIGLFAIDWGRAGQPAPR